MKKLFIVMLLLIPLVFTSCRAKNDSVNSVLSNNISSYMKASSQSNNIYADLYQYKITTIFNRAYEIPDNGVVLFQFSKPVFLKKSTLTETIDQIYCALEVEYKKKMDKEIENIESFRETYGSGAEYQDIINPVNLGGYKYQWNYTELCETTYEANGIISFTLNMDGYMGGVHNSSKKGRTFDFVRNRELKIGDVLHGDESQIRAVLENEFYEWFKAKISRPEWSFEQIKEEYLDEIQTESIKKQSGLSANFYLSKKGVHIFYEPYTVYATQNGSDIMIPWTRTELVRAIANTH